MAVPTFVKFTKPFYDGLGNPLIGATVTLRNELGDVTFYTCTEDTDDGYQGVYSVNVTVTRNYFIWVKPNIYSDAVCIGSWSPMFIPSIDLL